MNNKYQIIWLILAAVLIPVKTNAAIDETPRFINALVSCIEEKTVDEAGLERIFFACERGEIANPLSPAEAELKIEKLHAYIILQDYIDKAAFSSAELCEWIKRTRTEQAQQGLDREKTRVDTALAWNHELKTLDLGDNRVCGVSTNDTLVCWDRESEFFPTQDLGPVVSVSVHDELVCVVRRDGIVRCLLLLKGNKNSENETLDEFVPAELGPVRSISLGSWQICVVKLDSTLFCWKRNAMSSVGDFYPTGLGTIRSVSAFAGGRFAACAILADGQVQCWGREGPVVYPQLGPALMVAGGIGVICAVRLNSSLICIFGDGYERELKDKPSSLRSVSVSGHGIICAVKTEGGAICWGAEEGLVWKEVAGPVHSVALRSVAVGYARACMLFKDGSVTCWSSRGYVVVRGRYVSNIALVYRPPQELRLRVP